MSHWWVEMDDELRSKSTHHPSQLINVTDIWHLSISFVTIELLIRWFHEFLISNFFTNQIVMKLRNSGLVIRETMRWLVLNPMHSWEVLNNMLIKYVSNTYYIPENLVKYTIVLFLISFLMSACHTQSKYLLVQSSLSEYQDISRKQISEKNWAFKWSLSIFGLLFSQLLSLKVL